jgi:hypothetical protein
MPGKSRNLPPAHPPVPEAGPPKPVASPSRWRLTKLALENIKSLIRGIWSWQTIRDTITIIARHVCEPPRRRKKQWDRLTACLT